MNKIAIAIVAAAIGLTGCSVSVNRDSNAPAASPADTKNAAGPVKPADTNTAKTEPAPAKLEKAECLKVRAEGRKIDEKQTFPFDSKPFDRGCFVTLHDPEFDDPALDSSFFIYKDGKEVFKFPNQFNGQGGGCWVDAVAFEDLNGDDLKDVVVVGLCSAKSAPFHENMVYVNKGGSFTTNEEANYTLENMKTVKEITDFVKKNERQFFQ